MIKKLNIILLIIYAVFYNTMFKYNLEKLNIFNYSIKLLWGGDRC